MLHVDEVHQHRTEQLPLRIYLTAPFHLLQDIHANFRISLQFRTSKNKKLSTHYVDK